MSIESRHQYRFKFLKSEEWRGLRLHALARVGAACQVCGQVDWSNDAHHLHYNRPWNKTKVGTLVVLCRRHHDLIHKIMKTMPLVPRQQLVKMVKKDRFNFNMVVYYFPKMMTEEEFEERQSDLHRFETACRKVQKLLTASKVQV